LGVIPNYNTEIQIDYLQEIYVYASSNVKFTCHITSSNNASPFSAESLTFDLSITAAYSSLHSLGNQFTFAKDAYEEIIKYCSKYSAAKKLIIYKIDNPCNAPFIDKAEQQKIVTSNNLDVSVLVNGQ
jgi:hypothetical protein